MTHAHAVMAKQQVAPFDPSSISGLVFWVKADSLVLNDGDAVASWADSSANGYTFTQGVAGSRPTYKTAIVNSKPVVRFDGTADHLVSLAPAETKPFTAIAVIKVTDTADYKALLASKATGGLEWRFGPTETQNILKQETANIGSSTTTVGTGFVVVGVTYTSGGVYTFYLNGAADGSATANQTFSTKGTLIGCGETAGPNYFEFFPGDVAEIVKYDSVLAAGNLQAVEDYLGAKYAITVT